MERLRGMLGLMSRGTVEGKTPVTTNIGVHEADCAERGI